jgi:predicted amidohydrolase
LNILTYQAHIVEIRSAADRRAHVARMIHTLEVKCGQQTSVDLILLPELSTIEYSVSSFARLPVLAEPLDGETFQAMSALARRVGAAISFGFPRVENGAYFISQQVVGPTGEYVTHYDKVHLAQFGASIERDYFSRGQKLGIFDLGEFRFGIVICYDFRFSPLLKLLVERHGVNVILHPVAFTRDGTYDSWHHFVVTRALENQVYFLSLNRAGQEWGGSFFCPPWIDNELKPVLLGCEENTYIFTLDKSLIRTIRQTYPFRQDRLSDYSQLR